MITLIFALLMLSVFGKLFMLGLKAAWGITKFIFYIVFLPVILIGMVVGGLISFAIPILIIAAVVVFVKDVF